MGKRKLTAEQVEVIHLEYDAGASQDALAHRFGVSQATISQIVRGFSWKRYPPEREAYEKALLDQLYDLLERGRPGVC